MTDPLAGIQQAQLIARITQRVLRGVQLGEWGLTSHPVDDGSSLALDDQDFMPDLGPRLVSSTARFPAMNASENIVAAGQVFSTALTQERKLRTASVATLCRSAVEASAKTICFLATPAVRYGGPGVLVLSRVNASINLTIWTSRKRLLRFGLTKRDMLNTNGFSSVARSSTSVWKRSRRCPSRRGKDRQASPAM